MSNAQMTQPATRFLGSRLDLLTQQQQPKTTPSRSKSRTRLRSLSNASKKFIQKLQGNFKSSQDHQSAPPTPPVPSLPSHLIRGSPPPYTVKPCSTLDIVAATTTSNDHSRSSSSSSSSNVSSSSSSSSSARKPPLRERCNFQLTLTTDKSCIRGPEKTDFLVDVNNQLRKLANLRSQGPRVSSSLLSPNIPVSFPSHYPSSSSSSSSSSTTTTTSSRGTLSHLHEVLPYLSVAYCDSLTNIPTKRFTHVIKLIYLGDESNYFNLGGGKKWSAGHAHHLLDHVNHCQFLYLSIPRPSLEGEGGREVEVEVVGRGRTRTPRTTTTTTQHNVSSNVLSEQGKQTRLTTDQLIYARDFLSLSLPYYAEAHPEAVHGRGLEEGEARSADRVRVLICAPPRGCPIVDNEAEEGEEETQYIIDDIAGATDIVSLATCYLAYATGMRVHDMLKHFNDDVNVPDLFKGAVCDASDDVNGRHGVRFIEGVCKTESDAYPCGN